ncbi:conserved hypothetical protein [Candidatus Defluviicoccus seviourii]|uniref:Antitoxin SocA-like Panacea domain-containing protein n=2 Tax=root TaxID=1 RepID=A0A564WIC8_9PROT|nr:Uncharacterized phage-associated protein [uncultured Defluviicoccus sp.]VUX47839.1 conserved hypothetical protein [Candidatus Defluviicoccus seviourii]
MTSKAFYLYPMSYSPLAVANTFIAEFGGGGGIDHMKLQKLTYYAYGWSLAFRNKPLLKEGPEVWQYGPVFDSLYRSMASHGSKPIAEPIKANPFQPAPIVPETDGDTRNLIRWVWDRYGGMSGLRLSDETHKAGTPWQIEAAKHGYRVPSHHRIPDEQIQSFFKAEAARLDG